MCSGIIFVNKLDDLLKEFNISRKDFSEQLNLNQTTIAAWKTRDIIPNVELLVQISQLLEVSLEWLVTEISPANINDFQKTVTLRRSIRKRIYERIAELQKIESADNEKTHNLFFKSFPNLTYRLLYNWAEGRADLKEYVLTDIAYSLGIDMSFLINGTRKEKIKVENFDKILFLAAQRNQNDLYCLDNLTGKRRQLAKDMLNQLMELEHLEYVEAARIEKEQKKYNS